MFILKDVILMIDIKDCQRFAELMAISKKMLSKSVKVFYEKLSRF